MAACLIALGSNLGDRAANLHGAVAALARLPATRLVARSAWRETPPIGGPAGQGPFLNGAVLLMTAMESIALRAELARIEASLNRVRTARWGARTIDLDVLLYEELILRSAALWIPHPRMHYRRFVLEPAAEIAPGMVHPTSGWTIARLLAQLDQGENVAVIAAADPGLEAFLAAQIVVRLGDSGAGSAPQVTRWDAGQQLARRPNLLLAVGDATGSDERQTRRILHLPATGPVAWLEPGSAETIVNDALAAIASAWPGMASSGAC